MDAGHGSGGGRLAGSGGRALVGAQLRRVLVVGIVVPLAVGAVIALVGACWAYAAGAEPATMAMIAFTQAYPLTVGVCAVAVLAGDPLVEVQAALPVEFRCVQTLRAGLLLAAGMAGALLMFAPLEVLGLVYRDIGWAGALTPVGGAALMVLAAYVAVTVAGSSRSASLAVVAIWLFFALVWDPNMPMLALQRGLPLAVLLAARVAGALAAMALPSVGVLLFCAGGQMLHGNVWALLQAAVLLAGVVLPAALVAAALSAFAGSLLPRALARIAAIVAWFGVLFLGVFVPTPTAGGGLRVHIAADPVAQVLFGSTPLLDSPESAVTAATPLEAIALLALKLAAAVALLAAAGAIARKRTYRRR